MTLDIEIHKTTFNVTKILQNNNVINTVSMLKNDIKWANNTNVTNDMKSKIWYKTESYIDQIDDL